MQRQLERSTTSSLSMFMKYKSCFFSSLEFPKNEFIDKQLLQVFMVLLLVLLVPMGVRVLMEVLTVNRTTMADASCQLTHCKIQFLNNMCLQTFFIASYIVLAS